MDSDFILTNRTCAIAITADMSFKTALAADFKREFKNIELLCKQRPVIGGGAALPPAASQIAGKYLCFLVTRARGPGEPSFVLDEIERLPGGKGSEGTLASSVDPNRTTASTGAVCTDTCNLL